jgi:hypothetical protein
MRILELERKLNDFLIKTMRVNPLLGSVERSRKYRETRNEIEQALLRQAIQFLRSEALREIDQKVKVGENVIWTEHHEKQIGDIIRRHLKKLKNFINVTLLREFYLWLANLGGQNFFNKIRLRTFKKVNVIGVRFDLKNLAMIRELMNGVDLLIDSLDETTEQWLIDQFIRGKKEGLSSREIAEIIREKIPETYAYRAETIVATESAEITNRIEYETALRNEATSKRWTTAGLNICEVCRENESAGWIGLNSDFPSGHFRPPAHPNCKCLLEYEIPPYVSGYGWTGE